VKQVILYGEDKHLMSKAFAGAATISITDNLEAAVNIANQSAAEGDVVILSPACASFDMFKNFEHRGEEFMKMVRRLA
jgi:UDP-N-acetylmuramoylalanine--D-glutamate ligase